MRQNKIALFYTGIVSFVALIFAIVFELLGKSFISGILIGIFSSGLLTFLISIIGYITERRKVLEAFWTYAHKAIRNFNRFENEDNPKKTMDIVLTMNEFDYSSLDDALGGIHFIFKNQVTKKYIYDEIYKITLDVRNAISEKSYHFTEYKKATNGNMRVMEHFIGELDGIIMCSEKTVMTNKDGSLCDCSTVHNKIVEKMRSELNGRYYKIMYPCQKEGK